MLIVESFENNKQLSTINSQLSTKYADVVELVDSLDLGSNARACRFESCHPHQHKRHPFGVPFVLVWVQDENPSKCRCPVGIYGLLCYLIYPICFR